jgi:hypothetical protein
VAVPRNQFLQLLLLVVRQHEVVPTAPRLDAHRERIEVAARQAAHGGVEVLTHGRERRAHEPQLLAIEAMTRLRIAPDRVAPFLEARHASFGAQFEPRARRQRLERQLGLRRDGPGQVVGALDPVRALRRQLTLDLDDH